MSALHTLLSGLVGAGALFCVGAGFALALVGRRWAALWPALAAPLGLAVVVVASDPLVFFFGANVWSAPFTAVSLLTSAALAVRFRARARAGRFGFAPFSLGALVLGLAPQLAEGLTTTLSRGNHDYVFYQALAQSLLVRGYSTWDVDLQSATDTTAYLLRQGGWRSGVTHVSVWLAALTRAPVWQLDGPLWAAIAASVPGAASAAFGFWRPRSSRGARLAVLSTSVLLSGPLMLLRDTFASHLASLPMLLLLATSSLRALGARGNGVLAIATVSLSASLCILPDGGPLAFLVLGWVGLAMSVRRRGRRARVLDRAVTIGAAGVALIPCTVARVVWQLESLSFTGYLGARGASAGGQDASAGDLLQLLPTLLGLGTRAVLALRPEPWWVIGAVVAGLLAALVVLSQARRVTGDGRALLAALVGAYLSVLGLLQWTDKHYPAWKAALTMSVFVPLVLGVALDLARHRRRAALWAAAYAASLSLVLLRDETRQHEPVGVRREHVELSDALSHLQGELFLVGNLGNERTLRWELPLQLLLSAAGRHLHSTPHPYSYFRLSAPGQLPRVDGRAQLAVVVSTADADVQGRLLHNTGPVEVRDLTPAGSRAFNFGSSERWYEPEREPLRRFRWSRRSSSVMADVQGQGCWVFEARSAGPAATLEVSRAGQVMSFELSGDWRTLTVPVRGFGASMMDFEYRGPLLRPDGERRELAFALADPHFVAGCTGP